MTALTTGPSKGWPDEGWGADPRRLLLCLKQGCARDGLALS
jgi:hypothetical protein